MQNTTKGIKGQAGSLSYCGEMIKTEMDKKNAGTRNKNLVSRNSYENANAMKYSLTLVFSLLFFITSFASCDKVATVPSGSDPGKEEENNTPNPTGNRMRIKIGTRTFPATLEDNATATAFKALLPMTLAMKELNGNEKYFDFSNGLPTIAANPGTIQNGDLMLYGSKTLVLFYESFSTSYSYTRLGRVNDTAGLAAALGSGNVSVTFELE